MRAVARCPRCEEDPAPQLGGGIYVARGGPSQSDMVVVVSLCARAPSECPSHGAGANRHKCGGSRSRHLWRDRRAAGAIRLRPGMARFGADAALPDVLAKSVNRAPHGRGQPCRMRHMANIDPAQADEGPYVLPLCRFAEDVIDHEEFLAMLFRLAHALAHDARAVSDQSVSYPQALK